MKKRFIYIAVALVCSTLVMAQTDSEAPSDSVKGIHPYRVAENARHYVAQEDADWSLFLHGGFNVFDGDFASEKKHGVMAPSVGIGVDYKFNPTWGMGLDYTFRQVGVAGNTKDGADNAAKLLRGFQHQAVAYLSFDIFNAFFPKATTKLFALNIIGGGGAMFWRNTIQYPTGRFTYTTNTDGERIKVWESEYNKYHTANRDPEKMDKYKVVGALEAGLDFEFNVSRDIALGLRALYSYFVTDAVDGRLLSNNNDGVFDTELLLRWKFEAQKKSHVDNYVNKEVLSKVGLGAKSEVTPRDTVVLYYRDTTSAGLSVRNGDTTNIYNNATYITNPESDKPNYYYVYFENDKYNLSDDALVIIQQVADRMNENPNLRAAIIGYCDNVGSVDYNKRLGQNRSQNVMEELLYEHGVDKDRMFAIGKGIVVGRRSSAQYAPNRRVEIRLVNSSAFDDISFQYREDIEAQKEFLKNRNAAVKQ